MILLLDTRDSVCKLVLKTNESEYRSQWQSDRGLAKGLLGYIKSNLDQNNFTWQDIEAIGVFEGPGSFTSLRIGLTVVNTLADSLRIPIVGARGEGWEQEVDTKIKDKQSSRLVMPFYGSEANITTPRK